MNYNFLKIQAINAFKYYKSDDKNYKESMKNLYEEGKKNPSVTKIILDNTIIDETDKYSKMTDSLLKDKTKLTPSLFPLKANSEQLAEIKVKTSVAGGMLSKIVSAYEIPNDKEIQNTKEKKEFDYIYNTLYPKTGERRSHIINSHRIRTDKVTPKADWSRKILYAKTVSEYKDLYPKTLQTRMKLISKNQILNNAVTKRVAGFLNRLSYRSELHKAIKNI